MHIFYFQNILCVQKMTYMYLLANITYFQIYFYLLVHYTAFSICGFICSSTIKLSTINNESVSVKYQSKCLFLHLAVPLSSSKYQSKCLFLHLAVPLSSSKYQSKCLFLYLAVPVISWSKYHAIYPFVHPSIFYSISQVLLRSQHSELAQTPLTVSKTNVNLKL